MYADVLTKPLQVAPFRKMRSILMNMPGHYVDPDEESCTNANISSTKVPNASISGLHTRGEKRVCFTEPVTRAPKTMPRQKNAKPLPSVC